MEKIFPYGKEPPITRFSMSVLSTNTLFNDDKIKQLGYVAKYSLEDSINQALLDWKKN